MNGDASCVMRIAKERDCFVTSFLAMLKNAQYDIHNTQYEIYLEIFSEEKCSDAIYGTKKLISNL